MNLYRVWSFESDPEGEFAEEVEGIDMEDAAKTFAASDHNEKGRDSVYVSDGGDVLDDVAKYGVLLAVSFPGEHVRSRRYFRVGVVDYDPVFDAQEVQP